LYFEEVVGGFYVGVNVAVDGAVLGSPKSVLEAVVVELPREGREARARALGRKIQRHDILLEAALVEDLELEVLCPADDIFVLVVLDDLLELDEKRKSRWQGTYFQLRVASAGREAAQPTARRVGGAVGGEGRRGATFRGLAAHGHESLDAIGDFGRHGSFSGLGADRRSFRRQGGAFVLGSRVGRRINGSRVSRRRRHRRTSDGSITAARAFEWSLRVVVVVDSLGGGPPREIGPTDEAWGRRDRRRRRQLEGAAGLLPWPGVGRREGEGR